MIFTLAVAFFGGMACKKSGGDAGIPGNAGTNQPADTPTTKPAPRVAYIKADPNPVPNPVPKEAGKTSGTTTLTWDTGDDSTGEVYMATPGVPETLFGGGGQGSKEAPWINPGVSYDFILYAGTDHKKALAKVTVVGAN